jgi:phosphoenolpyruvate-protein kinase (PTS system EI component)
VGDLTAVNANIDQLEAKLAANTNAADSVTVLLDEVAQLLRDNSSDQEAINAIADRISSATASADQTATRLSEAVLRNTDVDPTPGTGNGGNGEPQPEA